MDHLPIFFDINGQHCLVVGGGEVAARKASLLVRAGGIVHVVTEQASPGIEQVVGECQGAAIRKKAYDANDLEGVSIVVAATDDGAVNRQVSHDAQSRKLLVNVVDHPELCNFIFPAIIDRSPIVVGVSSGGKSPVLARMIRARLESLIPASYGRLAHLAGSMRDKVKARYTTINERRQFWEDTLSGPIAEYVFAGKEKVAREMLEKRLEEVHSDPQHVGEVYLVGAGPGDPDLLTFRALRLMQQADVVLYDRLVSPEVLDLVRRDAQRINVGKARDKHTVPQDQINQYLVDLALEGHRVCRLKGGDPFIFGRGGEEIDKLAEAGIGFQVVPGITAAAGCASYSGIPLTHRDYSQSVTFVTGHLKDGTIKLDWDALARERQTLVFYMGLVGLETICKELVGHGLPKKTPVALVQQGTTRHQREFIGDLSTISGIVKKNDVHAPTLIIVGDVVKLHDRLKWYNPDQQPGKPLT